MAAGSRHSLGNDDGGGRNVQLRQWSAWSTGQRRHSRTTAGRSGGRRSLRRSSLWQMGRGGISRLCILVSRHRRVCCPFPETRARHETHQAPYTSLAFVLLKAPRVACTTPDRSCQFGEARVHLCGERIQSAMAARHECGDTGIGDCSRIHSSHQVRTFFRQPSAHNLPQTSLLWHHADSPGRPCRGERRHRCAQRRCCDVVQSQSVPSWDAGVRRPLGSPDAPRLSTYAASASEWSRLHASELKPRCKYRVWPDSDHQRLCPLRLAPRCCHIVAVGITPARQVTGCMGWPAFAEETDVDITAGPQSHARPNKTQRLRVVI